MTKPNRNGERLASQPSPATSAPSPDRSGFDLSQTDQTRRPQKWSDALNEYFYSYDARYPADFSTGRFDGTATDDVRLATITADSFFVDRRKHHIAKDAVDGYFLLIPKGGDIVLTQRGREICVRRGQFTFVSTADAYSYRQEKTESFHTLLLPGGIVRARKPNVDDYAVADLAASSAHTIFVDFATSFCSNAAGLDHQAIGRTADNLVDMLSLVLDRSDGSTGESVVQLAHRRRAQRLIEDGFRRPDLGVRVIAGALGVSERYVQAIFAREGETVSGVVRQRRLTEACRLLERRSSTRAHIASIAYAVGFLDPAYFTRVFRQHFGCSPTDYSPTRSRLGSSMLE